MRSNISEIVSLKSPQTLRPSVWIILNSLEIMAENEVLNKVKTKKNYLLDRLESSFL